MVQCFAHTRAFKDSRSHYEDSNTISFKEKEIKPSLRIETRGLYLIRKRIINDEQIKRTNESRRLDYFVQCCAPKRRKIKIYIKTKRYC